MLWVNGDDGGVEGRFYEVGRVRVEEGWRVQISAVNVLTCNMDLLA